MKLSLQVWLVFPAIIVRIIAPFSPSGRSKIAWRSVAGQAAFLNLSLLQLHPVWYEYEKLFRRCHMRYINTGRILAAQLTTPADNPLVTDSSRMIDVWFDCSPVRKELFKKMSRAEQDSFVADLLQKGF